ncbi:dihydropteroate synthase [Hydrogenophaga sp. SNF1]|uniref:dihydropteroate synthase n=1 Tax=Hydrogenophaga sp. SNF1 TaxID=3098762 RepID=UPI002ACC1469|nr:dihydropteroate synthase [Hydrogenophaga sp. SNF1]WQB85583.1 dihydropteroate synthase [Hydrogenophaga sp. SNF1]
MRWTTARFDIDLTEPRVMGIVNVTPDSFSDGGQHASARAAIVHAERLVAEGAHLLDIGGESTRPGSQPVPLEEELARVLPVLREALRLNVPLSVDTNKPEVMRAVLDLGADIVNDIWALRQGDALGVVAAHPRAGVCLMHMHRDPSTMQVAPLEGDVLPVVRGFLRERAQALRERGVAREHRARSRHRFRQDGGAELQPARAPGRAAGRGYPLLAGWSRKSSLGAVTGVQSPAERVHASVAAAVLAVDRGARVLRVHDVRATVEALTVWQASR